MTRKYQPIDVSKIKTYSVRKREHKSAVADHPILPEPGATAAELISSFPDVLGAAAFRKVVDATTDAVQQGRPVVFAFGAHVLKVGCGGILVDLIRRGIVGAIVGNGACTVHDIELATIGETSEEVADTIHDGRFGMVAETMELFDAAVALSATRSMGLGAAVGQLLIDRDAPFRRHSVFVAAREAAIPACVHVAIGTDTVHASGNADGAALGSATMNDFHLLCDVVSDLGDDGTSGVGGVWLNVGSAVVLPEVFLKAVSVARNLGADLDAMTTANFDMIRHYRPHVNVITRPVMPQRGHEVIGQHEILLPLFRQAVIDKLPNPPMS